MKTKYSPLLNFYSPITEEALLIGLSIAAILIIIGLIFGIFTWIGEKFSELFFTLG